PPLSTNTQTHTQTHIHTQTDRQSLTHRHTDTERVSRKVSKNILPLFHLIVPLLWFLWLKYPVPYLMATTRGSSTDTEHCSSMGSSSSGQNSEQSHLRQNNRWTTSGQYILEI